LQPPVPPPPYDVSTTSVESPAPVSDSTITSSDPSTITSSDPSVITSSDKPFDQDALKEASATQIFQPVSITSQQEDGSFPLNDGNSSNEVKEDIITEKTITDGDVAPIVEDGLSVNPSPSITPLPPAPPLPRVITHGIVIPLETPVTFVIDSLSYPDGFVYLVVLPPLPSTSDSPVSLPVPSSGMVSSPSPSQPTHVHKDATPPQLKSSDSEHEMLSDSMVEVQLLSDSLSSCSLSVVSSDEK
jgi:hypothetical protein